jgi:hypothetical protein
VRWNSFVSRKDQRSSSAASPAPLDSLMESHFKNPEPEQNQHRHLKSITLHASIVNYYCYLFYQGVSSSSSSITIGGLGLEGTTYGVPGSSSLHTLIFLRRMCVSLGGPHPALLPPNHVEISTDSILASAEVKQ